MTVVTPAMTVAVLVAIVLVMAVCDTKDVQVCYGTRYAD